MSDGISFGHHPFIIDLTLGFLGYLGFGCDEVPWSKDCPFYAEPASCGDLCHRGNLVLLMIFITDGTMLGLQLTIDQLS